MKKCNSKVAAPRGKKNDNTISPPRINAKSLAIKSGDGNVSLVLSEAPEGVGLWINDAKNPCNGVTIYKVGNQMAVGVRVNGSALAAALTADSENGEGLLQLTKADGETVVLTATEIVNAVKGLAKLCACPTAKKSKPKKAPKPDKAPPIKAAKRKAKPAEAASADVDSMAT